MAKLVSKVYGEALFELAMEEQKAEPLMEEVEGVRRVFSENPEFTGFLKHPGISKQEKLEVVKNVFQGRISDEMIGFLEIILIKDRFGELETIFQYFIDKIKEIKKIGTVYVTTAVELKDAQKAQIRTRLLETTAYLTLEIHYDVNPEIIGGMIIRNKDRVVDSSIRTKLKDLTKQLLKIQLG